ncbi:MAG: hypothetical protein IJQ82_11740 [Selenomonadaceae bacterium]|nr:hypothetical protein [Selenomonadaceae bacterium]
MAFGVVTAGIGAAATATKELLDEFRELQNQSYELNMSFPDTRNFLRQLRLGGGDIGDFEGYIRGITDAWVKGEYDDPEFIALRKYGAEITDATGRLKEFKDITEEVYQAWKQADAAGEGIEFLQLTGGEAGVRDAIQFFKRYEEAKEDAAKIFKAEFDDEQLHKLDRAMNLVEEQSKELKAALGDIFVPAVQSAAEKFFNVLHDGTEYLVENTDAIQKWGYVASEAFEEFAPKINSLTPSGLLSSTLENLDAIYDELSKNKDKPNTEMKKYLEEQSAANPINALMKVFSESDIVKRATARQREYNDEVKGTTKSWADFRKEVEAADKKLADKNPLNQYAIDRVNDFKDELEDLKIELEFGDDEYKKALAQLDLWKKREGAYKNYLSDEEGAIIDQLYFAKLDQIEKEHRDKIAEAVQSNWENYADIEYEMTHSAFDKQIRDIERWKEAQLEKRAVGEETADIIANAAMKEAQAFESEMDRIKGTLQSLEDKIFAQEHSQYENDLRRAQQERIKLYEEYQDKGILNTDTQALIERYFKNAVGKFNQRAAESRAKGGDYTKAPEGAMQSGGNGIMVIGADQIIDDGLIRGQQQAIGLLTDENRIRSMLLPKLDAETREAVERIQSLKEMTATQNNFVQQTKQAANDFQLILGDQIARIQPTFQGASVGDKTIIQGDQVTQISLPDLKAEMEKYMTPLTQLKTQTAPEGATDYLTPLSNIDGKKQSVLLEMQSRQPVTLETVVTPLNNIEQVLGNIATALSNQQAPQINISPNNNVNLGGAYVFDNALKTELVNDITSQIVDKITAAVQQATSRSSFGYSS